MGLFKSLFGAKSKATGRKGAPAAKGSARAKLIADAVRIQRSQGAAVHDALTKAIGDLGKTGPKILRDPDALARLVSLIQTRQTLNGLAGGDQPKAKASAPAAAKSRAPRR